MSTIHRNAMTGKPTDSFFIGCDRCSFCGEPADAFWSGHKEIGVCHRCVTEVWPRLAADSAITRGRRAHVFKRTFDAIEARYWRAAAIALADRPHDEHAPMRPRGLSATILSRNGKPQST
jgi:hypothetical protein